MTATPKRGGSRPGAGHPIRDVSGERATERVTVRLTPAVYARAVEAAGEVPLAVWVAEVVKAASGDAPEVI